MSGKRDVERKVERPDYDQALKTMLLEAHDGFLALIAPAVRWRKALPTELPAVKRQADLIWEVTLPDGQRGILHIELQTKAESDMGERLADYGFRLRRRQRQQQPLQLRSVVVFLRPTPGIPEPPFVIEWMGRPSAWYDFDVIRLWELPQE
ncbi:MAG: hypothetical protein IVW57_07150 [Ktedonobacterales bacterium]|nr:hypothetical protein [Ktedonobacterales bacterium]